MERYKQDFFAYFGGKQVYKATDAYLSKSEGRDQAKQIYGQLAKTNSYGYLVVCVVSKYPTECYDGKTFGAQPPPPEPKCPPGQVMKDGKCQPVLPSSPGPKCPPGQVLKNGKCVPILPFVPPVRPKPSNLEPLVAKLPPKIPQVRGVVDGSMAAMFPFLMRHERAAVQWVEGDVGLSRRPSSEQCPPGYQFSSRWHVCVPVAPKSDPSLHGLGEDISFTVTKVDEVNEAKKDLAIWGNAYPSLHPAAPAYKGDVTAPPWTQTDAKMLIAFADWWNADPKHVSKLATTGVLDQWHLFSLRAFVMGGATVQPGGQWPSTSPGQPQPGGGGGGNVVVNPPALDAATACASKCLQADIAARLACLAECTKQFGAIPTLPPAPTPGGGTAPAPAPGGGTAPSTITPAPTAKPATTKSETPWGWIIGGVALAGVAGLAIWAGARGVGGAMGAPGVRSNPDPLYPRAPRTGPLPGTYRMRVHVGPAVAKQVAKRLGAQAGTEHVYVDVAADGAYEGKLAVQDLFSKHGLIVPQVSDIRVWVHEKSHVWDPEPRDNPTPAKNIYWRDIKPEDSVTLEGKPRSQYYVVTKPGGQKFLAYWEGREAREAQRRLDQRARVTGMRKGGH